MKDLKVRKGYPEGKASRIPRLMTYRLVWAPVEIKDDKVLPNTINTLDLITRLSKNVQTVTQRLRKCATSAPTGGG